ncbi:hypothetical protein EIK77_000714 [Talaromyces pinophilus]|nr:hypothetical protein EIK77_000714 [Talaromyces pinophilus]
MRTQGGAAATATNWLFGFVCTQFTPTGIRNIGYRFYISKLQSQSLPRVMSFTKQLLVFACFNLIFVAVVYFLYPETANRTLEDLDAYFDRDSGHKTIIPIDDKVAKQTARPLEAIEAEARRIAEGKTTDLHKVTAVHIEDV